MPRDWPLRMFYSVCNWKTILWQASSERWNCFNFQFKMYNIYVIIISYILQKFNMNLLILGGSYKTIVCKSININVMQFCIAFVLIWIKFELEIGDSVIESSSVPNAWLHIVDIGSCDRKSIWLTFCLPTQFKGRLCKIWSLFTSYKTAWFEKKTARGIIWELFPNNPIFCFQVLPFIAGLIKKTAYIADRISKDDTLFMFLSQIFCFV